MNPTSIVRALLGAAHDALYVSSLGTPTSALREASADGPHLYMGGSMGTALAAAIGVAEKRPDRDVVALLGDGEALMGAGSFWSLAGIAPAQQWTVMRDVAKHADEGPWESVWVYDHFHTVPRPTDEAESDGNPERHAHRVHERRPSERRDLRSVDA